MRNFRYCEGIIKCDKIWFVMSIMKRYIPGILLFVGLLGLVWFATRRNASPVDLTEIDPGGPADLGDLDIITRICCNSRTCVTS